MKKILSLIISMTVFVSCISVSVTTISAAEGSDTPASAIDGWYNSNPEILTASDAEGNEDAISISSNSNFGGTVFTKELYDITRYDIRFRLTDFQNGWIGFTIAQSAAPEEISPDGFAGTEADRLDFMIYTTDNALRIKQLGGDGFSSQPDYAQFSNIASGEHTFGLRKIGDSWYPAIDGIPYILRDSAQDRGRANQLLNSWNTGSIRFGAAVSGGVVSEISVAPSSRFVKSDGTGAVAAQEDGSYTISGNNISYITSSVYDIASTDIAFDVEDLGSEGQLCLAVSSPFGKNTFTDEGDSNSTRLLFWIYLFNNQPVLKFNATAGAHQVWFSTSSTNTVDIKNRNFKFGFRQLDGKWYPAFNGVVYNVYDTGKVDANGKNGIDCINDFISANGTDLRFGIAGRDQTSFSIKNVDLVCTVNEFNAEDICLLRKHLLGVDVSIDKWIFDRNRDGIIDIIDLIKVKKLAVK